MRATIPLATLAVSLALTLAARADAIDGDWCSAEGKHLRIDGPKIAIPSGAEISGEYNRHGFRYVGPAGDPEEGQEIVMRQQSEEEMTLRRKIGDALQPPETWRRCQTVS
ncbi:MAG TPA: hypothetical protein PKE65_03065 [Rhizobiaceae bacterium]|nr:hypothetical protein [Rhizobiaceae bacterium]